MYPLNTSYQHTLFNALSTHPVEIYTLSFHTSPSLINPSILTILSTHHITRIISRIINQPYGNALLVGVGGSGRKSLTTMAVHIAEFQMFTIEITKSYGMPDWREDIKAMMNKAGILNKPTVIPSFRYRYYEKNTITHIPIHITQPVFFLLGLYD